MKTIYDLVDEQVKIVSFDVFDTVLTRIIGEPTGLFLILSQKLSELSLGLPDDFVSNFYSYRIAAERAVRRHSREVRLHEIYRELSIKHSVEPLVADVVAGIEIELEAISLAPVPEMVQFIAWCRDHGKKIVFSSDMYLSCSDIRGILQLHGLVETGDALYVSSEYRVTKADGGLFKQLVEHEKCLPAEVLHIGDNLHSDVYMPRNMGFRTYHFSDALLTPKEKILLGDGDLAGQYLSGAARIARLQLVGDEDSRYDALYQLGVSTAGPVFTAYLSWLARLVDETGVRRLYFVSRDGQILHEMAKILFRNEQLELRYLYGSRQAWHLPALTEISEREINWLTIADPILNIIVLAGRLLIAPEIVKDVLTVDGLPLGLDTVMSDKDIRQLRVILSGDGKLSKLIQERAEALRQDAIGYLRQEGLFDDVPWGMVDLGWFGNMQDSLQKLLGHAGYHKPVRGFYFGLVREPMPEMLKHPFLFSIKEGGEALELGASFAQLAELFASGDHGSTICYQYVDNRYAPVLQTRPDWIESWGVHYLRAGILNFTKSLPINWCQDGVDLRKRVLQIIKTLIYNPSMSEAIALGEYQFSSDQGEAMLRPFAPPLTFIDSIRYIRRFKTPERYNITYWLNGSRKRSPLLVNCFLNLCSQLMRRYNGCKIWFAYRFGFGIDEVHYK